MPQTRQKIFRIVQNCPNMSQNVPKCPTQTHRCPIGLVLKTSNSFPSHKTSKKLKEELQKLCEILSGEIDAKKQRQKSLMVEILRKESNLEGK